MRRICTAVIVGALLGACGQDNPPPPPPPPGVTPPAPGAIPQPVAPQPVAPGVPAPGTTGSIALSPGFTPDPQLLSGTAGGPVQASNLSPQCTGWISTEPNHLVQAGANFAMLRFLVNGGNQDTTLVVQRPDGSYACDDDTEGRHPIVQGPAAAGLYRIWVGAYTRGEAVPYTLGLSELGNVTAASLVGGVVPPVNPPGAGATQLDTTGTQSNFGVVALSPGFTPDPHVVTGTSGGSIDATTVASGCNGWIARVPDHILNAAGSFPNLRILVHSTQDTTLVVRTPTGSFLCNDDAEGLNPEISGPVPAGQYRIWVGSYEQGQNAPYRIGFTELTSVTTANLAQ